MQNTNHLLREKHKLCKYYIKFGKCREGEKCSFEHKDNVCCNYFLSGGCDVYDCQMSHQYTIRRFDNERSNERSNERKEMKGKERKRLGKKNTESFVPSNEPSDMTVKLFNKDTAYNTRDVILCQNLFSDMGDVYSLLLKEVNQATDSSKLWKLWHGDSHYIADDKQSFKEKSPLFTEIIRRISSYFNMDIKATRLNWYQDEKEWKPYHFDAAAVDENKAKTQNFTIGVSFGDTREVSFQHDKTRSTVNFVLEDGMTYGFGSQVNIEWRHGIPLVKQGEYKRGRISIIAWGWVDMK